MLAQLYCAIDDFSTLLQKELGEKRLLGSEKNKNHSKFTLSEIATVAVYYHYSNYKNFKKYYENYVKLNLIKEFPNAPSYNRIVELKRDICWFLGLFAQTLAASCTKISIIDSTPLVVCHNKRIYNHKTFKEIAKRGKTSVKWFFGFKLHLIINHYGEIISFAITPGNVSDKNKDLINEMTQRICGKLIGDKGYIGRAKDLYERGIQLIHRLQSNMKNQFLSLFDKFLLSKRGIVETIIGLLKSDFNLEHSRHRSVKGFFVNIFAVIIAYAFRPKKPSINLESALSIEKV